MYRLRYRAKNEIGFGEYSDIAYILAADKPVKPQIITTKFVDNNVLIKW